jgi:hypothetical protein
MLTGNWTWLHKMENPTRDRILDGLGQWACLASTLENLALRLNILSAACLFPWDVTLFARRADWETIVKQGFLDATRKLPCVPSWGSSPFRSNSSVLMPSTFWHAVDPSRAWVHYSGWSWDGHRGLLLAERGDLQPPGRFVVKPTPQKW